MIAKTAQSRRLAQVIDAAVAARFPDIRRGCAIWRYSNSWPADNHGCTELVTGSINIQ